MSHLKHTVVLRKNGDELRLFITTPLQTNTYAYVSQGECMVVDPGDAGQEIAAALSDVHVKLVVATHGHSDHVAGVAGLVSATGARFVMSAKDVPFASAHAGYADMYSSGYGDPIPKPDRLLSEGATFKLGTACFSCKETPGHTPGGLVFVGGGTASGICFTGDTLFAGSCGRVDLEGGSAAQMRQSLARLASEIDPSTMLFCGHGPYTTMKTELVTNPYLQK